MPENNGRRQRLFAVLLALSLLLNFISIGLFVAVRQAMLISFDQARTAVRSAQHSTFTYSFHVQQTLPFSTTVPINQDFVIPLHATMPVSTVVTISPELPLVGKANIPVPMQASIPVNLDIPIHVQQNVPVKASVPIDVQVPISITLGDTPAGAALLALDSGLSNAERWLGVNPSP